MGPIRRHPARCEQSFDKYPPKPNRWAPSVWGRSEAPQSNLIPPRYPPVTLTLSNFRFLRLRAPERSMRRATRPKLWSSCARPRACRIVLAYSRDTDMLSGASASSDAFIDFLMIQVLPGTSARERQSRPCEAHPGERATPRGFALASRDRYRVSDSRLS